MLERRWLPLLFALSAHLACNGSPTTDGGDVATDAVDATDGSADADAEPLPPGPRGQILGIPQTENESWTIPTLHAPVQVVRTEANVPHIYAANERDATVVWGFVTARDRYTQIELSRRLGRGIISQLLGEAGLAADQGARDRGYTYVAQRLIAQMSATELDLLDAYAEGINAYIVAVQHGTLPVPTELGPVGLLLGTTHPATLMQPVAREDIASVLAVVLFNSSYADDDLLRARVAETFPTLFNGLPDETLRHDGVVQDIFNRVQPLTTMTSAAGFGVEGGTLMTRASRTRRRTRTRTPQMPNDVLDRAIASNEFFTRLRRGMRDADYGSNAWATAGRANADGHAIVSGDGHLPLSVPTLLHQIAIDTSIFGDGTDPQTFIGLAFPGIPLLPLGTNGEVAYSFTYLYGDQTDWYSEEIQLDSMGRPSASRFGDTWHPLVATNETYTVANVPALMSMGRTEMWTRWTTFDGRWIASIEGRPAMRTDTPGAGESIIEIQGNLIIPADVNGDGHISAVSFDYTGFDVSDVPMGLRQFSRAHNVGEIHTAQHRFVGFAQNFVAGDSHGNVYYSGYTATPCRSNLMAARTGSATTMDLAWGAGADPRLLLDGNRFGGFTIALDSNGLPDETAGTSDPTRCLVPYADWPTAINPDHGYVFTANNDLGGTSLDNNLANDRYYVGGSWDVGYRAQTISNALAMHTATHTSSLAAMAAVQGDHHSNMARQLLPFLFEVIDAAHALHTAGSPPTDPADQRLLALYDSEMAAIDEVRTRLDAWRTRGLNAASGVETFYDMPTADDRNDAVATMLFNAWMRNFDGAVFGDERLETVFALDPRFLRATTMLGIIEARGSNPHNLASWNAATQESVFFDDATTSSIVETSREDALHALVTALATLRMAPTAPGIGGFGTNDMSQWLWGLRHMVAFPSLIDAYAAGVMGVDFITNQMKISPTRLPLAMNLPMSDPRANLPWFPRPGDIFAVDAANPPATGTDYIYRNGPVMRMVIELQGNGRIRGQNVIPGGQSGLARSPNFDDQARLWLGNQTLPMRFDVDSVVAGATGRETYHP